MTETSIPLSIESGGKRIPVEHFGSGTPRGIVILLHGSDGMTHRASLYRSAAAILAEQGMTVFLPHYFARTGTERASFGGIAVNFPEWRGVLSDMLDWIAGGGDASASRIGVVGFSLGASIGLAQASYDRRIDCLVDYFGPFPEAALGGAFRMPPTLILHGDSDRIVPVSHAHATESFVRSRGALCEIVIYPGEGHGFGGLAALDAGSRTIGFLTTHLRLASGSAPADTIR